MAAAKVEREAEGDEKEGGSGGFRRRTKTAEEQGYGSSSEGGEEAVTLLVEVDGRVKKKIGEEVEAARTPERRRSTVGGGETAVEGEREKNPAATETREKRRAGRFRQGSVGFQDKRRRGRKRLAAIGSQSSGKDRCWWERRRERKKKKQWAEEGEEEGGSGVSGKVPVGGRREKTGAVEIREVGAGAGRRMNGEEEADSRGGVWRRRERRRTAAWQWRRRGGRRTAEWSMAFKTPAKISSVRPSIG